MYSQPDPFTPHTDQPVPTHQLDLPTPHTHTHTHTHPRSMTGGADSPAKSANTHTTTTLAEAVKNKYAHLGTNFHREDLVFHPTVESFTKAAGKPWRCDDCKYKSCCHYQAFDSASCEEAISPHHVFKVPVWRMSNTDARLKTVLDKAFADAPATADDDLFDKLIALEDKHKVQASRTRGRADNITTKLDILAHYSKVYTDSAANASHRDGQAARSNKRKLLAAHRARKKAKSA